MSFFLLLGLLAFIALSVFLGYLGYKALRKRDEESGAAHRPPGTP